MISLKTLHVFRGPSPESEEPAVEVLLSAEAADPEDLLAGGLPVDRADEAVIAPGAALPPEWETLVRKVSAKVETGK